MTDSKKENQFIKSIVAQIKTSAINSKQLEKAIDNFIDQNIKEIENIGAEKINAILNEFSNDVYKILKATEKVTSDFSGLPYKEPEKPAYKWNSEVVKENEKNRLYKEIYKELKGYRGNK